MNWKMTAKTILVQMHHKLTTFEHINKHLVLAVQNELLEYMKGEFNFAGVSNNPNSKHSCHFHSYKLNQTSDLLELKLTQRLGTDVEGIGKCLGLQAEAKVELEIIVETLKNKMSEKTLFNLFP